MTSKKNGKTSTYDPKLYSTCQYIIQNSEKFKEYAILKDRMPFNQETNICLDLHNSLINIFHFLTGEYQKTSKNDAAKGSDVTASLYLNELPEDKLAMVLTLFYEYTHKNRKSVGQIFDVNIEKTVPLLNVLIETLNQDYIDNIKEIIETLKIQSGQESMEKNNYNKALNIVYNIYKSEIIKFHHSYFVHNGRDSYTPLTDDISFYHKVLIENNVSSNLEYAKNMRSLERKYPQFRNLKKAYYTWLYCDLCCYSLLQFVTFMLTEKEICFSSKELNRLNSIILELIQENSPQRVEARGNPEKILFYFISYYHRRDIFLQDTNMLKYIMKNCEKRKNPESQYALSNPLDLERKYSLNKIQNFFTEGEDVRKETFRKNYEACKNGIDLYNKKTRREIVNNLVSQKAVYREIFVDSTLYKKNRHTSKNIFNNFLKLGTMGSSDYYFLNEKINMGMYREYGLIDEFYAKNEFQENLYHLVSLILSQLYPNKIRNAFKKAINRICLEFIKILPNIHFNMEASVKLESLILEMILNDDPEISP